MRIKFRYITGVIIAVYTVLAFFGWAPKDFQSMMSLAGSIETWWVAHAAYPSLAALGVGLFFSLFLFPETLSLVRRHLFPPNYEADIDAKKACQTILERSKWAKRNARNWRDLPRVMYEESQSEKVIIERRILNVLDQEIHKLLRNERLTCWGRESLSAGDFHLTPEKKIAADYWDRMEIHFSDFRDSLHTRYLSGPRNGELSFVGLRFCKKQLFGEFPLTWSVRKPTT
jgi:hypothetical protein